MAATAGLSVTFDPMGKMFQDAKVDRNSKITTTAGQMIIPGQFDFNCPSGLREEAY
jgi:hypothetical protein